MELSDYFRILRQRGWLVLLLAFLTASAAYGFSKMQTPIYKSTTNMLITSRPDYGQTQAAKAELRNYAVWLNSSFRAARVISDLQLDMEPLGLLGQVKIVPSTDTSVITIEVENENPDLANDIGRVWGEQLISWRNEKNAGLQKADHIDAELTDNPRAGLDRPNTNINTVAGGVFGLLLGVLLIFLLEWFASGIVRRPEEVERYLDVPVIGKIP
ncbi:MAG: YveK family protein [Candidatus Promineifilaceae bacterium]